VSHLETDASGYGQRHEISIFYSVVASKESVNVRSEISAKIPTS